jgi:small subunit ribosomal protein S9
MNKNYYYGIGRRKEAISKVILSEGKGKIIINKGTIENYLQDNVTYIKKIKLPLTLLNVLDLYDIEIKSKGGGITGQVDSISLAISNALLNLNPENRTILKTEKLLTRNSRVKERKKYGLKKARKASQFSKR